MAPGAPPRSRWAAFSSGSASSARTSGRGSRASCGRSSRTSPGASSGRCGPPRRCSARRGTMRAVLCKAFGPPESLVVEETPAPALREGAVLVAVHAAGINFGDTLMIEGKYQEKPPFPFTPGFEIAGEVVEIGAGVTDLKPGDRVMGTSENGGYAE